MIMIAMKIAIFYAYTCLCQVDMLNTLSDLKFTKPVSSIMLPLTVHFGQVKYQKAGEYTTVLKESGKGKQVSYNWGKM